MYCLKTKDDSTNELSGKPSQRVPQKLRGAFISVQGFWSVDAQLDVNSEEDDSGRDGVKPKCRALLINCLG
jgi:hypothetical protein